MANDPQKTDAPGANAIPIEDAAATLALDEFTFAGVKYANKWAQGSLVTLLTLTAAVKAFNSQEVR